MVEIEEYPTFHIDAESVDLPFCNYLDIANSPEYDWCNKFSILLCNIRSCRKNFLDITSYFDNVISNYLCIILVETWLTNEYDGLFILHYFKSYNAYCDNYVGGIRLYVKNALCATILSPYTFVNDNCEMLCVQMTCDNNKFCVVLHLSSSHIRSCKKLRFHRSHIPDINSSEMPKSSSGTGGRYES